MDEYLYTTEHQGIYAKVVADSLYKDSRITTMELRYPRFIHAEFMTHRMFSRNASSSRAIPVEKMLKQIAEKPAMPIHWGKNQPGMQANEEHDDPVEFMGWDYSDGHSVSVCRHTFDKVTAWKRASDSATDWADRFNKAGYHKQIVNRLTEPFQFITVIVTATEWRNFFNLRLHPAAQPEIHKLAELMNECYTFNEPHEVTIHLPYIREEEYTKYGLDLLRSISAARCARVSYKNHDQSDPDGDKDKALADRLFNMWHLSPFEHQAHIMTKQNFPLLSTGITHQDRHGDYWSANFKGWIQNRQVMEQNRDAHLVTENVS